MTVRRARSLPRSCCAARAARGRNGSGVRTGTISTASSVRCDRPLPLQVDGEDLGDVTEAVFEAERDAVTVLV